MTKTLKCLKTSLYLTLNFNIKYLTTNYVQKAENKKITFGQITNKEQISEQIYINPIIKEEIGEDNFSRDNKIKLTCTFVNTDAKETKVEKEIVLHEEGYFTIGDTYYTLTGQKIK